MCFVLSHSIFQRNNSKYSFLFKGYKFGMFQKIIALTYQGNELYKIIVVDPFVVNSRKYATVSVV
jgi:hypothetical protein